MDIYCLLTTYSYTKIKTLKHILRAHYQISNPCNHNVHAGANLSSRKPYDNEEEKSKINGVGIYNERLRRMLK